MSAACGKSFLSRASAAPARKSAARSCSGRGGRKQVRSVGESIVFGTSIHADGIIVHEVVPASHGSSHHGASSFSGALVAGVGVGLIALCAPSHARCYRMAASSTIPRWADSAGSGSANRWGSRLVPNSDGWIDCQFVRAPVKRLRSNFASQLSGLLHGTANALLVGCWSNEGALVRSRCKPA
jgi:hypothetical protein